MHARRLGRHLPLRRSLLPSCFLTLPRIRILLLLLHFIPRLTLRPRLLLLRGVLSIATRHARLPTRRWTAAFSGARPILPKPIVRSRVKCVLLGLRLADPLRCVGGPIGAASRAVDTGRLARPPPRTAFIRVLLPSRLSRCILLVLRHLQPLAQHATNQLAPFIRICMRHARSCQPALQRPHRPLLHSLDAATVSTPSYRSLDLLQHISEVSIILMLRRTRIVTCARCLTTAESKSRPELCVKNECQKCHENGLVQSHLHRMVKRPSSSLSRSRISSHSKHQYLRQSRRLR